MTSQEALAYIKEKYGLKEEFPWPRYPDYYVVRHQDNDKWFVLFMTVKRCKLGYYEGDKNDAENQEEVDVLNIKSDPDFIRFIAGTPGYFPAYHMSKKSWLTILLDGTVSDEEVKNCIDNSFLLTASAKMRRKYGKPEAKEWLVPANPKYYDIVGAFEKEEEIIWKQGSDRMEVGDIAYMYVAVPWSAILYRCQITEVNLPWTGDSEEINIRKIMKIKRLHQYQPEEFTLTELAAHYDVRTVRGPRSLPVKLSKALKKSAGLEES